MWHWGGQLREVWNAKNLSSAEAELKALVEAHRKTPPELAAWLETAIPEGLAALTLPEHHRKRMRISNPIERAVQQELKRRIVEARVSPNNASLLRLVTAVLVEVDETRQASTQPDINRSSPDARSGHKRISGQQAVQSSRITSASRTKRRTSCGPLPS